MTSTRFQSEKKNFSASLSDRNCLSTYNFQRPDRYTYHVSVYLQSISILIIILSIFIFQYWYWYFLFQKRTEILILQYYFYSQYQYFVYWSGNYVWSYLRYLLLPFDPLPLLTYFHYTIDGQKIHSIMVFWLQIAVFFK